MTRVSDPAMAASSPILIRGTRNRLLDRFFVVEKRYSGQTFARSGGREFESFRAHQKYRGHDLRGFLFWEQDRESNARREEIKYGVPGIPYISKAEDVFRTTVWPQLLHCLDTILADFSFLFRQTFRRQVALGHFDFDSRNHVLVVK